MVIATSTTISSIVVGRGRHLSSLFLALFATITWFALSLAPLDLIFLSLADNTVSTSSILLNSTSEEFATSDVYVANGTLYKVITKYDTNGNILAQNTTSYSLTQEYSWTRDWQFSWLFFGFGIVMSVYTIYIALLMFGKSIKLWRRKDTDSMISFDVD